MQHAAPRVTELYRALSWLAAGHRLCSECARPPSWGCPALLCRGAGLSLGLPAESTGRHSPGFHRERHQATVLRAKAILSSMDQQGSRAPRRGGRGGGVEVARPGVTSNGARAGPGDPLAANTSPATSRRDAGPELSRTHSRGETKNEHLGYLEGAISANIPPPPRQRAVRS